MEYSHGIIQLIRLLRYAIANLAAGNGVLLKHAESVAGTGEKIKEIFEEAGLPKEFIYHLNNYS